MRDDRSVAGKRPRAEEEGATPFAFSSPRPFPSSSPASAGADALDRDGLSRDVALAATPSTADRLDRDVVIAATPSTADRLSRDVPRAEISSAPDSWDDFRVDAAKRLVQAARDDERFGERFEKRAFDAFGLGAKDTWDLAQNAFEALLQRVGEARFGEARIGEASIVEASIVEALRKRGEAFANGLLALHKPESTQDCGALIECVARSSDASNLKAPGPAVYLKTVGPMNADAVVGLANAAQGLLDERPVARRRRRGRRQLQQTRQRRGARVRAPVRPPPFHPSPTIRR